MDKLPVKKIRWGIIGAGGIADRRTLPGLIKCELAELIAVMNPKIEAAEALRDKYSAKRAYASAEELLRDPEIDAVYIASPVWAHAQQARLAADHGKHILLEKPPALNFEEARELLDYCDSKNIRVAAGFMMRFGSCVNEMKRAYMQGKIGDLVSIYSQFTCWYPDIEGSWRQSQAKGGGGALMDMGIHMIDLIHYITGQRITHIAAIHETQTFSYETEDASSLLLRLENGAQCCIQSNFNIPDEAAKWRFELFGTRGRLAGENMIGQVDGGSIDALFVKNAAAYDAQQNNDHAPASEIISGKLDNLYTREIEDFCIGLLKNKPFTADAREALEAQRVVDAAYRSWKEGKFIQL